MTVAAEADVLRADDRRFEAMRKEDWAALDAALADDLTYVHSSARLESTVRYLAVYTRAGEQWRMLAWQSTRQPDA